MTLKLYKFEVTRTSTMVVAAEDQDAARIEARAYIDDAFDDGCPDEDVDYCGEIRNERDLESWGWDANSIPYGAGVDDRECRQILEDMADEGLMSPHAGKQLPLIPASGSGKK